MKKILTAITIVFISIKPYAADFKVGIKNLSVEKKAGEYRITTVVECSTPIKDLFSDYPLYISSPSVIISGTAEQNIITESNTIYSERNFDFNNDGDFNDHYRFSLKGKNAYINNRLFESVQSEKLYRNYIIRKYINEKGNQTANSVTEKGIPFFLDSVTTRPLKIRFLFGDNSEQPPLIKIENPSLILIALKPVINTKAEPLFQFMGMKNRTYITNDYNMPSAMDMFARAVWINIPLKPQVQAVKLEKIIKGINPPFKIEAFIDFSFQNGISLRTPEKSVSIKNQ